MSSQVTIDEKDEMLAAEYALGTLPHGERVSLEKRIVTEANLRNRVAWWNSQFVTLADEVEPVEAPASVLRKLESRLFTSASTEAGWWRSLGFWRGLSVASLAGLIVVGGLYANNVISPPQRDGGNVFVAQMAGENSDLRLVAYYDDSAKKLRLKRTAGEAAESRDFELWIIAGTQDPVSLGVLPTDAIYEVDVPEELQAAMSSEAVLAITDEPDGGSATGKPTGALLAAGPVQQI
ncbi:anti-sigma factor domain-containing protein [Ahrensia sp. 13_GOM-1096m]|uniref:anti-sigma factor n=1 Tax=Ahrensia sp. 13_GOM-1096m TaxID=1380380 RepID=UPI00047C4915|nr:anti-sigma factor [Ahrensia sp. 13_GOM-1096m]